ncbi:MAG: hypothetical protein GEU98_11185 [Pseudonocardiaceae bacterium]|nr:hypothetical protein [Pseudonocardiaceae bacterium]
MIKGLRRSLPRFRVLLLVTALAASLAALLPPVAGAEADIRLTQVNRGNIFNQPATPSVRVATAEDWVKWCAYDHWNEETTGEAEVTDGSARVELPVKVTGYYELFVTTPDGNCKKSTARTRFALLPPEKRSAADDFVYSMQTHFTQRGWSPEDIVPLIKNIGVESVRDSQPWNRVERGKRGNYQFPADLTNYMRVLDDARLDTQIGLGPANELYDNKCTPYTQEGRDGLARYAREVLNKYGDQIGSIGIYNEPNGNHFGDVCLGDNGGPADSLVKYHYPIAKTVYEELEGDIRMSAPELAGAAQGWDGDTKFGWLKDYFAKGGLSKLDVVSLHPYRPNGAQKPSQCEPKDALCRPEGLVGQQITPVRNYLDNHGARDKQIWITEMGWKSDVIGEAKQAAYLPRAHVLAMNGGVTKFNWYNMRDHKDKNFGLIRRQSDTVDSYTPKPSYVAYAVMTSQLSGLSYERGGGVDGVQNHLFSGGTKPTRVMWSPGGNRTVHLEASGPVEVVDMMGGKKTLQPGDDGTVSLTVSGNPKYVHGDVEP